MVMEDMDGLTTLQRMKEILGDQCPKIVMMSAYDVKDKFDTARRLGALECVKKPLDFALLKETIYRALAEGDRPHICIVDDDRFTCTVVKKVLADNGYEVEIANSGGEVMRMLGKDAFSVAIINAGTTGVNAIDVYEKIRLQNRDIGVIIVSNTAFDENTFNALQKSNYSFLQKPFDAEQILRMVQNIQNRKKEK
jgi:DNA-binding NtrC family response regulator